MEVYNDFNVKIDSVLQAKVFVNAFLRAIYYPYYVRNCRNELDEFIPALKKFRENAGELELRGLMLQGAYSYWDEFMSALSEAAAVVPDAPFTALTGTSGDILDDYSFKYENGKLERINGYFEEHQTWRNYCPHCELEPDEGYRELGYWEWIDEGKTYVCPRCGEPPFPEGFYKEERETIPVTAHERTSKYSLDEEFELLVALTATADNRYLLSKSKICGCPDCMKIYHPSEIKKHGWYQSDGTARCPYCGGYQIFGDASGYPITNEFLGKMHLLLHENDSEDCLPMPVYEFALENTDAPGRADAIGQIKVDDRALLTLSKDEKRIVVLSAAGEIGDISAESWLSSFAKVGAPVEVRITGVTPGAQPENGNGSAAVTLSVDLKMKRGDAMFIHGWDRIPEDIYDSVNE